MGLEPGSVFDLIRTLEQNRTWGALTLNFQDGRLTHADLRQTLKPVQLDDHGKVHNVLILERVQ
jgi:hypothetical protein